MISVRFQGRPFNITVIQVYAPTTNAEEAELEWLNEPTRPSRTNTKKRCPFHHRGLECKTRKSRDAWSNRQICPWSKMKQGKGYQSFAKGTHWSQQSPSSNNTSDNCKHGHHQVVNI